MVLFDFVNRLKINGLAYQARQTPSEHFVQQLIEHEGVFLLPGETFGCPGYFRICLGVEPNRFAEAMEKLDRHICRLDAATKRGAISF